MKTAAQTLGVGGFGRAAGGEDPIANFIQTYAVGQGTKVLGGYVGTVARLSAYVAAGATAVDAACTAIDYFG